MHALHHAMLYAIIPCHAMPCHWRLFLWEQEVVTHPGALLPSHAWCIVHSRDSQLGQVSRVGTEAAHVHDIIYHTIACREVPKVDIETVMSTAQGMISQGQRQEQVGMHLAC